MSDPDRLDKIREHLTHHQDIHEDDGWWLLGLLERAQRKMGHAWDLADKYGMSELELVGEVERLRRFRPVWAVRYGNYEPSEVIALYDNEQAAQQHVELSSEPLEALEMEVRHTAPQRPDDAPDQ